MTQTIYNRTLGRAAALGFTTALCAAGAQAQKINAWTLNFSGWFCAHYWSQRQRVAMGRAIVRDPQVFLFDEPLSNLDDKLRVQMRAEIKSLCNRLGTTTIYATHDQVEAMTMADRIVVLNGGRIEQVGTPLELYDRPRNFFVTGFLGSPSMNLWRATTVEGGLRLNGGDVLHLGAARLSAPGTDPTLGVRPENLVPDPEGPIRAKVQLIEPTGAETVVALEVGGEPGTMVVKERLAEPLGSEMRLSIVPGRYHLFKSGTGEAIADRVAA